MQRYNKGAPIEGTPYENIIIIFIFLFFFLIYEDNNGALILFITTESPLLSKRRPQHQREYDGVFQVDNHRVLKWCGAGGSECTTPTRFPYRLLVTITPGIRVLQTVTDCTLTPV